MGISQAGYAGADDAGEVAALRRQDIAAFERFYAAQAPALLRYLTRLCGDAGRAEDALQDSFVAAYRALPRTRPDLEPRPWLYRIAGNTARSAARRAYLRRLVPFSDHDPDRHDLSGGLFDAGVAEADLVERALAAIGPAHAAPLLLHWREGFSIDELCVTLDVSRDGLKKRLYRAKRAFAAAYAREIAAEEGRP